MKILKFEKKYIYKKWTVITLRNYKKYLCYLNAENYIFLWFNINYLIKEKKCKMFCEYYLLQNIGHLFHDNIGFFYGIIKDFNCCHR